MVSAVFCFLCVCRGWKIPVIALVWSECTTIKLGYNWFLTTNRHSGWTQIQSLFVCFYLVCWYRGVDLSVKVLFISIYKNMNRNTEIKRRIFILPAELHRLCGWDEVVMWCSSLPVALYSLQTFLQIIQIGCWWSGASVCMRWGVGVCAVLLLVQLSWLFELRQLTMEHVSGWGHRWLRGQEGRDKRALLRLILNTSNTLL